MKILFYSPIILLLLCIFCTQSKDKKSIQGYAAYHKAIATALYEIGDYKSALNHLDTALMEQPDEPAYQQLQATIIEEQRDISVLANTLKFQLAYENQDRRKAILLDGLAELQLKNGLYQQSVLSAIQCLSLRPKKYNAIFHRAVSLSNLGYRDDAIRMLAALAMDDKYPDDIRSKFYYMLGRCLIEAGEYEKGHQALSKVVLEPLLSAANTEIEILVELGEIVEVQ